MERKERNLTLEINCPICGKHHSVKVNEEDYIYYIQSNALTQHVFYYLTATEREKIISGMCVDCQKDFFRER